VGGEIVKGSDNEGEHSFARKVGYAQQADIHLSTSTVREALEFSAALRQSEKYSLQARMAYVNEVIRLLDMGDFVDAIVGVPGEGLNVEQRKKVTIGVELAVRPELLLFLDEPTSGLDSNTAWAICKLLRTLARSGQAILCTIHQPSGDLFQMFDKLLLLSQDGKQAYFGDIGPNCKTVIDYFEKQGARHCREDENPAEWLLEVTKDNNTEDLPSWAEKWKASQERTRIESELQDMKKAVHDHPVPQDIGRVGRTEFARGFLTQLSILTKRNLLRDWRTPSYLYSKSLLVIAAVSISILYIRRLS
jgi:ATP-binding cassette subfamily G (WHITE) protein 2 (PDR)